MSRCRIGFIGAGDVAARHARTLALLPLAELVAVADIDPARAARFAADHGLRAVPHVEALLETGLNAVYVCVRPSPTARWRRLCWAPGWPCSSRNLWAWALRCPSG
ncbi:MAG: Gfo/Idh/MocA family oxidoreductase [Actinobacteria bacterium]|nr:Gfo/Idh/MocA family oxidoreductase [Actinomycetota bacterium]